jgi:ribosomal protein S18 acetylase RimI-like enzyme
MNVLKVSRRGKYYELIDDTTNVSLTSLEISPEVFSVYRREKVGFPKDGEIYYLGNFVTENKYRRKGYGRELLNLVKKKTKGKFIYLIVRSSDEEYMTDNQLIKFYQSIGFKVHEKKDCYDSLTWMVLDNR